jgi:tRNA(Arg) A34 adenosine deaminase TadA
MIPTGCCVAHAEIIAIVLANRRVDHFDLGAEGTPFYEMAVSTEPCAMCLGAIVWSGVRRLVCGARDQDARSIGFDEGPKSPNWVQALESRGITVLQDVCSQ